MVVQSSNIGMRSERYYRKREEEVKSLQLWGTSKNGQDELQMGNTLKEGGVDLDTIGSLLGHSDRSATEIYAHITDNRQRAALSAIPCGKVVLEN